MAERRPAKKTSRKAPGPTARSDRDVVGGGEFRSRSAVRTALIPGNTFHSKAVQYVEIDGYAMVEGDIVLGAVADVEATSATLAAERRGEIAASVIVTGNQFRWPDCRVPYDIDSSLPNRARVTDAIAHWQTHTSFTFVERTAANAATFPDWVTFRPSSGCSSSVGKQGGQQFVNLGTGCTTGNAIHEIGHTVGLWHEQSREDRDSFVTIHWDKIQPGLEHNFDQHISDGDDVGVYDYGSIMHYPRDAFSVDGSDTITPADAAAVIGQRTALSAGDIAGARALCPRSGTVIETLAETIKERIPETIKELSPETFKERFPETIKELSPETIKERIPETVKEQVETAVETLAEGTLPGGGGPVVNPQIGNEALPFAMATPRAPGVISPQSGPDEAEAMLAQLAAINAALDANTTVADTLTAQRDQLVTSLNALGWQ